MSLSHVCNVFLRFLGRVELPFLLFRNEGNTDQGMSKQTKNSTVFDSSEFHS